MSKQEQHYSAILSDLYQGTFDDVAWDRGLMGRANLVGGEGPLLMSCRHGAQAMTRYDLYSSDRAMFSEYTNRWLPHDPRVPRAACVDELDMFREATLLDRGQWKRTPIFNEYLKPNDAAWVLGSTLHNNAEKFTLLCIQATRSRGRDDADDADTVRPLMPHLRRALEIKDRLEYQEIRTDALRQSAEGLSFGLVLLDSQGRLLEASAFASAALQSVCPMAPTAGQTLCLPEPAQRELALLLATSLTQGRLSDGLIHIHREPGRLPLSILVAPAPVQLQSWILATPKWLLFIFDPEQGLKVSSTLLEREMHLSPREAQIAGLLATGLSVPQIVVRLGNSHHTLRTHLKACFNKLGCHTQSELVRRVMASAAAGISKQHN